MLICSEIHPAGTWDVDRAADVVMLDFDGRHRRRYVMHGEGGLAFMLDLPKTTVLRDGDGLVLRDGTFVRVMAAPEQLVEITAPDSAALLRIAWHLGNRHLPTQLMGDRLRIRDDHVMVELVRALGGSVTRVAAPFDSEGGAFNHGAMNGHSLGSDGSA